ncbi:MAG: hydrogenase maturation factor [Lachnospiraceae bacterium]|nr:hydrogenase maturation factor [Lachnospiraceae bacterium]
MKNGKVSESVLKRSVLRQLKTRREEVLCGAGVGDDCAIFTFSEHQGLATCMQEAAVAVQADMDVKTTVSMAHLITKCVNNLVVSGAQPVAAMITYLLPQRIEESYIKQLVKEAEEVCHKFKMQIAGGQTRVSNAVSTPYAVVTGYGKLKQDNCRTIHQAIPGWDIVISKWIGLEGTAAFAHSHREQLLNRYPAYLVEEATGFDRYLSILPEATVAARFLECVMHDASEGGIFAALWELAEGAGVGLEVDLKKLPLRQETVEVCECCNINPYELKSGGSLVIACKDGMGLVQALAAEDIPAVVVGKLTDSNDRIIRNEDEVRYMDRPRTDEIYK